MENNKLYRKIIKEQRQYDKDIVVSVLRQQLKETEIQLGMEKAYITELEDKFDANLLQLNKTLTKENKKLFEENRILKTTNKKLNDEIVRIRLLFNKSK